jgi:hypothetical protein
VSYSKRFKSLLLLSIIPAFLFNTNLFSTLSFFHSESFSIVTLLPIFFIDEGLCILMLEE